MAYAVAFYDSGEDLTGYATAAVTVSRFVSISGAKRIASQALASDGLGGNIPVAHTGAGLRPLGVSSNDQPTTGGEVQVMRGHKVVPVESGAAATAGAAVMSDATGRAVTWTSAASEANFRAGILLNSPTAAGQVAIVALDL